MAETEEYFPRGGKKPTGAIYKPSSNFLGTHEKADKKKKKPKKKAEGDDGYLSDEFNAEFDKSISNCAVGLSSRTVKEGMLVLGRIRTIRETMLQVSLPRSVQGNVMACHISEPYNKLLEAYVNDKVDSVQELAKMFRIGQYVVTKVLEVESKNLMLSMMPQHINSARVHSDLHKGTLLQAAVSSVEDHGYVMDLGILNTRAFLPKKNSNEEIEMDVGQVIWCVVKDVTPASDNSIVTLSCQLGALQGSVERRSGQKLLPGTAVEFTVDKALENGIEGHIFDGVTCYIQRPHTDNVKGKKPTLGQKIRARILYELPTRKTPFLTMRNIFEKTYPDMSEEQKFQVGDIVDDAKVTNVTKHSIVFRLGKRCIGTMAVRRVDLDDDIEDELALSRVYPPGSEHRVRILNYNLSDYNYAVSDEAKVLKEKYFTLDQLAPGHVVEATITTVAENGLNVQIGRIRGFVPYSQTSDSGIISDPKKGIAKPTKKKFKVGQTISARVLSLDQEHTSVVLTMKPSLMAEDLKIVAKFEDAVVGQLYTGYIKYIKDFLVVAFYNGISAFIPRHLAATEPLENLTDAFHVGQIVNCTIIKADPETKKLIASLLKGPIKSDKNRETSKKRKNVEDEEEQPKKKSKKEDVKNKEDNKNAEDSKNIEDKKKEVNEEKIEEKTSEESDAIETDIGQEDSDQILTPADMLLTDLSDCDTREKCKKRVVSLSKAINNRLRRVAVIEKKLERIEEKGLNKDNKKFHTAMHSDKLIVEERIKALAEAFEKAQAKLAEFPEPEKKEKNYKTTKQKREEKRLLKQQKKEEGRDKTKVEKKKLLKQKKKEEGGETNEEEKKEIDIKIKKRVKEIKVADGSGLEVPSVKDFWAPSEESAVQKEESTSSEDEEVEAPKKKRKKLTAAEKVAKAREEEEKLRRAEAAAVASAEHPRSVEQFERALLARPDAAELWLAYAALHLQSTEIEKARAVCRRALNTISFREEDEKLNIWIAMLNLEHRFGTKESQQKTLEEAIQMNEPFKVHSKLLDVLSDTGKTAELLTLIDLMMKKHRRNPEAYKLCGAAAFGAGLVDKARQVMQKAVQALEKKEHVSVLVHFALLERSHGSRDRAEAIFEQILGIFPQRVDVCSVYVDMLFKAGDPEAVRQVLERMTSQKLPARKMKVLYKKWIEIEEKIGEEDQVEKVRQRAAKFIESAKF